MLLTATQPIWSLLLPEAYAGLQSQPKGLSSHEAGERLERFGANRLPPLKRRPLLLRFTDQLVHFMALLLWVAGGLAFIDRAPQLGWAIWAVILINGAFSFWQEFKAERTLQALAGNLPPTAAWWWRISSTSTSRCSPANHYRLPAMPISRAARGSPRANAPTCC